MADPVHLKQFHMERFSIWHLVSIKPSKINLNLPTFVCVTT